MTLASGKGWRYPIVTSSEHYTHTQMHADADLNIHIHTETQMYTQMNKHRGTQTLTPEPAYTEIKILTSTHVITQIHKRIHMHT